MAIGYVFFVGYDKLKERGEQVTNNYESNAPFLRFKDDLNLLWKQLGSVEKIIKESQ